MASLALGDEMVLDTGMDKLMRVREVMAAVGLSRASIYKLLAAGRFPAPVRVGIKAVRWRQSHVEGWISCSRQCRRRRRRVDANEREGS